jgi:hypothetical protein
MPTTPFAFAGLRIDPEVSVPIAIGARFALTPMPEPGLSPAEGGQTPVGHFRGYDSTEERRLDCATLADFRVKPTRPSPGRGCGAAPADTPRGWA